jgi:hypothetical protein
MKSAPSMSPIIEPTSIPPPKPTQHHHRWNESDEKYLRQAIDNGINITEIAQTLGRSRISILQRIHIMGLSAKSINYTSKCKSWSDDE